MIRRVSTAEIESHEADVVVLATGGYSNVFFLSTNAMAHIQKAPFTLIGLKLRDKSMPMEKGKSILSNPPPKFIPSSVQPTPIFPYPEMSKMANDANATPSNIVSTARALFDKRWINKA